MLTENELDYIRIGNEFSCDPKYSDHLLKEVLDDNATLNSIKSTLADAQIVVATTSTMNSNAALFNIKHFDLAIIDEASQILEPNIIGLLTASPPPSPSERELLLTTPSKDYSRGTIIC